jgi:HSP20 family protein
MALPVRVDRGHLVADPFEVMRQDLGVLGRFFGGGLFGNDREPGPLASLANYGVDIREDADHIYVEADLPGFRKEDIDISLENGTLTIVAERKEEITEPAPGAQGQGQQAQGGQQGQAQATAEQATREGRQSRQKQPEPSGEFLLRERSIQRFVRSFTLPPNVDEKSVQASLENGVLRITLNKREDAKPKKVQVN